MPRRMRVLVTAGNTREMIDSVRYLSNISTGVMGYELARAAASEGHPTVLVSGPGELAPPRGVKYVSVTTSEELARAAGRYFPWCDVLFMTSAVSDFRPARWSPKKIRRRPSLTLRLVQTPDIVGRLAAQKGRRTVVGFCLETENLLANARKKLGEKKVDYMVANYLGRGNKPFGRHPTTVTILSRDGVIASLARVSKARLARFLVKMVSLKE